MHGFKRKPSKGANPDEVVALGAAAYGGILAGALMAAIVAWRQGRHALRITRRELACAALIGLLCGATAAVLRSIFDGSTGRRPRTKGAEKPALANFIRRVRSVSTRKGRVKS